MPESAAAEPVAPVAGGDLGGEREREKSVCVCVCVFVGLGLELIAVLTVGFGMCS